MAASLNVTLGALLGGVDLGKADPCWVLYRRRLLTNETLTGSGCLFFPRVLSCLLPSCFPFLSFPLSYLSVFYGLGSGK